MQVRFIELFAGVGGFRYGLETLAKDETTGNSSNNSGGEPSSTRHIFRCIYANELDRYACSVYRSHWNDGALYEGDIRTIDPASIPKHDLLCGGFPCQSFSIAGNRGGFTDIRGTLFYEICRIARAKGTPYIWLENVKGLLSAPYTEAIQEWNEEDFNANGEPTRTALKNHKAVTGTKGWVFLTILNTLWQLGYDCQWQVLNSKNFGVPQNRERVFIIGHLRTRPRPQIFPLGETNGIHREADGELANCIDANYGKGWLDHGQRTMVIQSGHRAKGNVRTYQNEIPAMTQDYGTGGGNVPMVIARGPDDSLYTRDNAPTLGSGSNRLMNRQQSLVGYCDNRLCGDIAPTLMSASNTNGHQAGISHKNPLVIANAIDVDGYLRTGARPRDENGKAQLLPIGYRRIRRLTPVECERLQGFPDNWTAGVSDTQRYKMMGNAVTTNVITAIGRYLMQAVMER